MGRISIEPDEDYAGEAVSKWLLKGANPEFKITTRTRVCIEREIMVSLAGPISQRKFNPRSVRHYHGRIDYMNTIDLASYVYAGNIKVPSTSRKAFMNWLSLSTKYLIRLYWPDIEALAAELLKRRKMTGKELRQWFSDRLGFKPRLA